MFIEVTTKNNKKILLQRRKIVIVINEGENAKIFVSENANAIETKETYEEVRKKLHSQEEG